MSIRSIFISAALAGAIALPTAAFAQQAPPAPASSAHPWGRQGHHHRGGFMHMFRSLNLSDQQKTQIRQIMQQFRQAHPAGSQPDPQARKQMRDQVMNVLTPQQRQQLQTEMQQRHERAGNREPAPQSTPQP